MPKKRFFTKNNERVGKKSGKPRGKYKKHAQAQDIEQVTLSNTTLAEPKFPNISLNITEKTRNFTFSPKIVLFTIGGFIILAVSVWQTIGLFQQSIALKDVVRARISLASDMQLWENIAQKYPGYRDAYFQAAVLAYRLGDSTKEKANVGKVLEIDPNYKPAKDLVKISE